MKTSTAAAATQMILVLPHHKGSITEARGFYCRPSFT